MSRATQGPIKLYSGLSAGLFRQITYVCGCWFPRWQSVTLLVGRCTSVTLLIRYTMPRLGLFDQFKTIAAKHNGGTIEVLPHQNYCST